MAGSKVTIHELSEYCNVSIATISRVINNNGRFSEETRQKVLKAIDELGYIPNTSAKSLRTRSSRMVGIMVNTLEFETVASAVSILSDRLFEGGYAPIVCQIGQHAEKENFYYQQLRSINVCGIILIVNHNISKEILEADIPVIFMYRNPLTKSLDRVSILRTDDYGTGRIAAEELLRCGCRDIAFIRFKGSSSLQTMGRQLGLIQTLYEHQTVCNESRGVACTDGRFSTMLEEIGRTIDEAGPAEGYFCATDVLALALVRCLETRNCRVPEDVKVIGCNDMTASHLTQHPITTIRHHIQEMCSDAISVLGRMLAGEVLTPEERDRTYDVELVRRETT